MKQSYNPLHRSFCGMGVVLIGILLVLPFFQLFPVGAQSPSLNDGAGEHETDVKIRNFFDALARGSSTSAFDELLRQSPYGSFDAGQASVELQKKVAEMSGQYGGILHYEKYDAKRIGEDVILTRYILKYDNAPIIWTFAFYRKPTKTTSNATWMFVQLHFDTDLRLLL